MTLEFTVSGHTYRAGKLDAKRQFHVTRRLAPLLSEFLTPDVIKALRKADKNIDAAIETLPESLLGEILTKVAEKIGDLKDEPLDYVLNNCLAAVERQQAGGGWAQVMARGDRLMFEDLEMKDMLTITWEVLRHNLSGFFGGLPRSSPGEART